jgi:hypothetical protein
MKSRFILVVLGLVIAGAIFGMFLLTAWGVKLPFIANNLTTDDVEIRIDSYAWSSINTLYIGLVVPHVESKDLLVLEVTVNNKMDWAFAPLCAVLDGNGNGYPASAIDNSSQSEDLFMGSVPPKSVVRGKLVFSGPRTKEALWLSCSDHIKVKVQ